MDTAYTFWCVCVHAHTCVYLHARLQADKSVCRKYGSKMNTFMF